MSAFKLQIIQACKENLTEKTASLNAIMQEVTASANSESKSSAGDKHETSRAMMQLEQEKLGKQITDAVNRLNEFNKIEFNKPFQTITHSSLVETDRGFFLIASSIGKIAVDGKTVFVISAKSPLALALVGAKLKDTVIFNGVLYSIIKIS